MTRRSMHTDSQICQILGSKFKEQVTLQSSEDTNKVGAFPTKKIGSMTMATHPTNLHSEIDIICIVNLNLLSTELSWQAAIIGSGYTIFCPTQKSNRHVTTISVSQLIKITCISRQMKRAENENIPLIPCMAPLTTCWAATSYTCRVVVAGPKTLSASEKKCKGFSRFSKH